MQSIRPYSEPPESADVPEVQGTSHRACSIAKHLATAIGNGVPITQEFICELTQGTTDEDGVVKAIVNIVPASPTRRQVIMFLCGDTNALPTESNTKTGPSSDMPDESWRLDEQERAIVRELQETLRNTI